jgi:tetratricopeptide (TPR) repeat protein
MDRLAMLQQFVAQRPNEPFARYGLAMEFKKRGMLVEANTTFAELIARHPNYIPAYLMAGQALQAAGDPAAALDVFTRGVAAAQAAGDDHALGELESARAALA